ncbi:zinc finger protein ZFPM2b isoform X1 [Danio rerio]|uniref:Neural friend of GATA-B n=1 Tax=Danio rerio TaxID=7955 RepID=B2GM63_DANRE|nr:zinc finger protein, FOG family member 2b isoform X1 [Danio rerio]AAI63559.1 Zfpm2b protein [Danio rerio]AAT02666.1 neural friend of GATA-B [Danio rerio]|eukprot:XP_005159618.1 zinc finger protein, FOG family member 2b isoform X1 [Danio rerio]
MSRRKQSNPKQFKRVFENGLEADSEETLCEKKEILKEEDQSVEDDPIYFSDPENGISKDGDHSRNGEMGGSVKVEQQDSDGQEERVQSSPVTAEEWDGPRELKIVCEGEERKICSCQALLLGTTWGPFPGKIEATTGGSDKVSLVLNGGPRWLMDIMWVSAEDGKSNCAVYSKGGHVWCSTTKNIMEGDELAACVVDLHSHLQTPGPNPYGQGMYPSRQLDAIQLLPQQAAMASILPGAIINSLKSDEVSTGSNLKCTICDYSAETLMVLQHHILSHLSQTGLRCGQCHFSFQTPREMAKHQELHGHNCTVTNKPIKEDKTDNAPNSITSNSQQVRAKTNINDLQESTAQCDVTQISDLQNTDSSQKSNKGEANSGNKANLSYSRVKSEPSSPRLASSPIQHHLPPAFPLPPFIPHVPFSQDITMGPQASEILAKMSELVHRRLRHGGNSYPPVMYSALVPKGATCFECNITFNNLDNYLVHKKHYCNSRWENTHKSHDFSGLLDKPAGTVSPKIGASLAVMLNAGHPSEVKGQEPKPCNPIAGGKVTDELTVQVKKASTPSGAQERPNGTQLDLQSQKMPPTETDPSHTTCEACKITFSRHETYMVHKQYYCATRHDPQIKRANNKGPANQKAVRPRKRRKAYELANSEQEQMPPMGMPSFLGMPTLGGPYMSKDTLDSFRDHQRYNMIQGLVPKYPEASLTVTKSALVSKCNIISKEETDAPIDLSKKCVPQFGNTPVSPKGLMDYHECVVCKISFNKVEDYLKHKQNFCPGTILQSASTENKSIKKEVPRNTNNLLENPLFEFPAPQIKTEHPNAVPTSDTQASSEEQLIPTKDDLRNMFQTSSTYPSPAKKMRPDEQIWPYYEIKPTDYATGMLVSQSERRQSPNEGSEGEKDQPMPDGSHLSTDDPENQSQSSSLKDNVEIEEKMEDAENKHESPTPESRLDDPINSKDVTTQMPSIKTEEVSTSLKKALTGSIANSSNVKYCRPCDIQFNNLSNFITHKKFYCSSQTAEHVK